MDYRYLEFDARAHQLAQLLARLEALFNQLLLRTDGDAEEALRWLERIGRRQGVFDQRLTLADFKKYLEKKHSIEIDAHGQAVLTRAGEQRIRAAALESIFGSLVKHGAGEHRVPHAGDGPERLPETREWRFGDALALLDAQGTLQNAIRRGGIEPITIEEEDLRVHETEHLSSCATVMLLDLSHSMVLYGEDRITPAKQVALALAELITTRYPKDSLEVACFGDTAWQVPLEKLPYLSVGPFHTNTRAGLELARELLRKKRHQNRQIILITDGKPSALTERDGTIYKNPFGLDERVVNKTLEEAETCRRHGIPITTFMLTDDPTLVGFVETLTKVNRGRAYFSQLDRLGTFVFADYIENRRRKVR